MKSDQGDSFQIINNMPFGSTWYAWTELRELQGIHMNPLTFYNYTFFFFMLF